MGLSETREVKTTFICDFCKHQEVKTAEYSHDMMIPNGWCAMAIVPADQKPRVEPVPRYTGYGFDCEPRRYCLSADREVSMVLSCPACSVYGLHVIKTGRPEAAETKSEFKLSRAIQILLAAVVGVTVMGVVLLVLLLKR